jgi:Rod binding domain-containing protein
MELGALQKASHRSDIGEVGKVKDTKTAATEFEALLIGQLMSSAFSADQMGMSGEMDSGSQTMLDFGKEHLSRVIAEGGGLGLGKMIEAGLSKDKSGSKSAAAFLKR